jgi:ParB-like chromosome segregation protein Spo0J
MYNDQLEQKTIPIADIFLDPNNPRFWSEQTQKTADVPDSKVSDESHQSRTRARIANHGLEELKNSILRNGFLPLDRIVVRELNGVPGKYVVIEGNRRLAALKMLREQIVDGTVVETGISEEYLKALKENSEKIEVLVYKGSEIKDIAWILQGIRHIGGIRNWMAAQQGKLVADQIDKEGLTLSEAGQRFGLSAQAVGRRYRSYKALQQMREDEEFQSKAKNDYYSLFEEAIRDKNVKDWLAWDDGEKRFKNTDNLKQFYSWICPDEEHAEQARRIHDPRHISFLGRLIATKQDALLGKIEKHEIGIEAAEQKLSDDYSRYDWSGAFRKIAAMIGDIPNSAIDKDAAEIITALENLDVQISNLRKKAAAVIAESAKSTKI